VFQLHRLFHSGPFYCTHVRSIVRPSSIVCRYSRSLRLV
jgi:hypothetical protein